MHISDYLLFLVIIIIFHFILILPCVVPFSHECELLNKTLSLEALGARETAIHEARDDTYIVTLSYIYIRGLFLHK
jgi:hypothetical protein